MFQPLSGAIVVPSHSFTPRTRESLRRSARFKPDPPAASTPKRRSLESLHCERKTVVSGYTLNLSSALFLVLLPTCLITLVHQSRSHLHERSAEE